MALIKYGCFDSDIVSPVDGPVELTNFEVGGITGDITTAEACMKYLYGTGSCALTETGCGLMIYTPSQDGGKSTCYRYSNDIRDYTSKNIKDINACSAGNTLYVIGDPAKQRLATAQYLKNDFNENIQYTIDELSDERAKIHVLEHKELHKEDLVNLPSTINKIKCEYEYNEEQNRILNNFNEASQEGEVLSAFDSLLKMNNQTAEKNRLFINDKQRLSHKIDTDLNIVNWSLKQNSEKDKIYNKIKNLLSIIIIILCIVAFISLVYFAVPSRYIEKLNKLNGLNNLFGKTKIKITKNEAKRFNSLFN